MKNQPMRHTASCVILCSTVVLLAGCPRPSKSPPKVAGTGLQLPLTTTTRPESQLPTPPPTRSAKQEMLSSLTSSFARLEQRLAEYRSTGPSVGDLKQVEELAARVHSALAAARAAPEEGDELMLRVHAVNTALFNLDQFLTDKGH